MRYFRGLIPWRPESLAQFLRSELGKLQDAFVDLSDTVVGTVTLQNATTSTTITHDRIRAEAVITLMPKSAAAAAMVANTYQSTTTNGSLTLAHTNPGANVDFNYVIHIPLNTITR